MAYPYGSAPPKLKKRPAEKFAEENPFVENVLKEFRAIRTGETSWRLSMGICFQTADTWKR